MIRRPPRSPLDRSSAASDGYKRQTLNKVDALEWELRQIDGVETTHTLALLNRRVLAGLNEGNPRWYEFLPNQDMLNTCLLYTSPSPRDRTRSRMPSSA